MSREECLPIDVQEQTRLREGERVLVQTAWGDEMATVVRIEKSGWHDAIVKFDDGAVASIGISRVVRCD